jgi:hypothetical protein
VAALADYGLHASAADGINTWVPVADEQTVLLAMATQGVGVAAGSPFILDRLPSDHVRVTAGLLRDGAERVAGLLAAAAAG